MISASDLNRCINILAQLNANTNNRRDRNLILELGYIIKQELDLVNEWNSKHYEQSKILGNKAIDVDKLLEDNAQLYKENETLLKNLEKMKNMIESKIPSIQEDLSLINQKFDFLNNHIETNLC
jgi:hypothetical protein